MGDSQKTTMRNGLLLATLFSISSLSAATINVVPTDNLQDSINAAGAGDTLLLGAGVYNFAKTLVVAKDITVEGVGKESVTLKTTDDSKAQYTVRLLAGSTLKEVTVTRGGNTVDAWAQNLNKTNVIFQTTLTAITTVENCIIEKNYNGLYANYTDSVVIKNNIIRNNRNGIAMVNGVGFSITDNVIKDNTVTGITQYTNPNSDIKYLTAPKIITGNTITGNWYSQAEVRIPADSGYSVDLSDNHFGTGNTVACVLRSGEPKYEEQIPEWAGGTALPPADAPTIVAATSSNVTLPATFPKNEFVFFPQFAPTDLAYAANNVPANSTIKIFPGKYPVVPNDIFEFSGQKGWYLPIGTVGLTLVGMDKDGNEITNPANAPLIYGDKYTQNGAYPTQNFISAFADSVTIKGLRIMSKIESNKSILIQGLDAHLENLSIEPNTLSDTAGCPDDIALEASKFCGSIYFYRDNTNSDGSIGNATLKNVTLNKGFLSAWNNNNKSELAGTLNLTNTTINFRDCTRSSEAAYKITNLSSTLNVITDTFTVQADPAVASLQAQVINCVPSGTTVELAEGMFTSAETILIKDKSLTIIGAGKGKTALTYKDNVTVPEIRINNANRDNQNITFRDFKLVIPENSTRLYGFRFESNKFGDILLDNIAIIGSSTSIACVKVASQAICASVKIANCDFTGISGYGFYGLGDNKGKVTAFTITNSVFKDLQAGFYIKNAITALVSDCTFDNAAEIMKPQPNRKPDHGAAKFTGNGNWTIDSCLFKNNKAPSVAIGTNFYPATTVTITNNTFEANNSGAAIMSISTQYGTRTIKGNKFLSADPKLDIKGNEVVAYNYWGTAVPNFTNNLIDGKYVTSPYYTNEAMTDTASNVITWTAPSARFTNDVAKISAAGTNGAVKVTVANDSKDSAVSLDNNNFSFVKPGAVKFIGTPVWGDTASEFIVDVSVFEPKELVPESGKIILSENGVGVGSAENPGRASQLKEALEKAAEVEISGSVVADETVVIKEGQTLTGNGGTIYGPAIVGQAPVTSAGGFNRAARLAVQATAKNIIFDGKDTTAFPGVILMNGMLDSCIVQNWTSTDTGAAVMMHKNAVILNSFIRNNAAVNGGGIAMFENDTGLVLNSILTNNTAKDSGGAVFGGAELINCVIANNTAKFGGAAFNAKVFNSIIAGNDSALSECTVTYSAIDTEISGVGNIRITNGAFVKPTVFSGANIDKIEEVTAANWAPVSSTLQYVDLGKNAFADFLQNDINGNPRVVQTSPFVSVPVIDIGAYECQIPADQAPVVITATPRNGTFTYGLSESALDSAFTSVSATFNGKPVPADSMNYNVSFISGSDSFDAPAMLIPGTYGAKISAVQKSGTVTYDNVITIEKADLKSVTGMALPIVYNQKISDAVITPTAVSQTGAAISGTAVYTDPDAILHAGSWSDLPAVFTATDSNLYNPFNFTVSSVEVKKAPQTLTVSPTDILLRAAEEKQIAATASSNLAVTFAAANDNIKVTADGKVTGSKIGHSTVKVAQDGMNGTYADYLPIEETVNVQIVSGTNALIAFADTTVTYSADSQLAKISVTIGGQPVTGDTMLIQYVSVTNPSVRFGASGPTNADTYLLTVIADSGIDFWGKAETQFVINPFMIAADSMIIADTAHVYSGNAAMVTVTIDSAALPKNIIPSADTDYMATYNGLDSAVNAGNYVATVQFIGNYMGSDTANMVIAPFAVNADSIVIANTTQIFNGTPKSVTVTFPSVIPAPLASDYKITYSGKTELPIAVGTYPVAVTLSGNFTGSATAALSIISNNPYPNSAEIGIQAPGTEMVIPSNILGLPSLDKKPKTVAIYTKPLGKVGAKPSKLAVKLNDYEVGTDTLYLDVKGTVLLYNKKEYNTLRKTMFTQDILKNNPAIQQDSAVVTVTFSVKNVEADSNVTILMVPPTIIADSVFEVSILNGIKADSYFVVYGENFGTKAKAWFEYKDLNGKMKKKSLSVVKKVISSDGTFFIKGVKPTPEQLDSMMILKYNKIVDDPTIKRLDLTIDNKNGLDAVSVIAPAN